MSDFDLEHERALSTARVLLDLGHPTDVVYASELIPAHLREWVRGKLTEEANRTFERVRVISAAESENDWVAALDRSGWQYWPTLRRFLLVKKGWPRDTISSLDDASDRILAKLAPPSTDEFDIRGLVLGYVQSGKTANFTAVIAKAADTGYKLVVVFSGIDNGLRRQTQLRLNRELTGYPGNPPHAVEQPPVGKQWHQFTTDTLDGDFNRGRANTAALQGSQPVLLVVKKNGTVLRRLRAWFEEASEEMRRGLPALFIDDEADQASVDTKGSYQQEDGFDTNDPSFEEPAVINRLIRGLLNLFPRRAYIAYTATPFANVLIPHDNYGGAAGDDLYPRDFLIDLPKPRGYFGTEEFFGRFDSGSGESVSGLDVLRDVPDAEVVQLLSNNDLTPSLEEALYAFILAGAARAYRGKAEAPCTMLVHTTQRIADQTPTRDLIESRFNELKDEWRYDRFNGLRDRLRKLWDDDFKPTTQGIDPTRVVEFEGIEEHIATFAKAVQVREINSDRGDVLDFDLEPTLKAIAVGGNKLARGLTLEGLLVSYFARQSLQYDTLLQMARWYGYRGGYEDLTRIYTTGTLQGWFADLALVEHRLRQDIRMYEMVPSISPREVGVRILRHPSMQVTSALKRRHAVATQVSQSYSGELEQTFRFPLGEQDRLALLCERNRATVHAFLTQIDAPAEQTQFGPLWEGVQASSVVRLLRAFDVVPEASGLSPELIAAWIEQQNIDGDVTHWSVLVRGREKQSPALGAPNWLPAGVGPVWSVARSRIGSSDSLGVITTPGDEAFGLTGDERLEMQRKLRTGEQTDENRAARLSRSSARGLLIFYPISKFSGHDGNKLGKSRRPIYVDPQSVTAKDLIGLAVSLPKVNRERPAEAYLEGTARWRPVI
jgi:hypothetical protein